VPVPPPGVETDLTNEAAADGRVFNTLRERLEDHRANPTCASCHQIMDPIGLALENFDLVGRWRDSENGFPLDTHTEMVDGTAIDGPVLLRSALLARSESLVSTVAEKLLIYAIGRGIEAADMPAVRKVVNAAAANDYRFSDVVLGIVNSEPFLKKVAAAQAVSVAQAEENQP
jgi:hypothetical protein